jgi:transcriptional regulator
MAHGRRLDERHELLHGALEPLILRTLADADDHGYGISRRIETSTGGAVRVEDGSLYPALYRLEKKALIRGEWGVSEARKRARFYHLTDKGRRHLAKQTAQWAAFAGGVSRLLLGGGK